MVYKHPETAAPVEHDEPVTHDESAHHKPRSKWIKYLGAFALGGAILAVVIAIVSATLARYGIIGKLDGFRGIMFMLMPAGVLAVVALVTLVLALVLKVRPIWQAALGLVLSLGLLVVLYAAVIRPAGDAPRLHDITTDVNDPPQFRTLTLREDNLVPFDTDEEWRAAHRQGYPDIQPIVIGRAPGEVLAQARALAEERGWDIASYDAQRGFMEATAYAGYIRFMDDVIVEVTPVADGSTRVDMRSVSRVGVSDLGYNAARVEEFLTALRGAG